MFNVTSLFELLMNTIVLGISFSFLNFREYETLSVCSASKINSSLFISALLNNTNLIFLFDLFSKGLELLLKSNETVCSSKELLNFSNLSMVQNKHTHKLVPLTQISVIFHRHLELLHHFSLTGHELVYLNQICGFWHVSHIFVLEKTTDQ